MQTTKSKLEPTFKIELNDFIYPNTTSSTEEITIDKVIGPKKVKFLSEAKQHPSSKGVYVIFLPEETEFNATGNKCIYVGEGIIKNRLYSHHYHERFGDKNNEFIVIYYEIEDEVNRKAVERILIKYYNPSYNKDGESKTDRVRKHSDYSKRLLKTIEDIRYIYKDIKLENGAHPDETYADAYDFTTLVVDLLQAGFELKDIENELINFNMTDDIETLTEFLF
ncbi:TPA: GIY-YIG nuclease family protein [Bacillus tropicus]|nr:GIY-YIG nuclease family protein [Bacillus tropicus]